jgi:predicted Na+-dependent transporter
MHSFITALRLRIEDNVNPIFIAALVLGFVVPYADKTPSWVVMALLAIVMFFGCAKITLSDIKELRLKTNIWFYIVRYLLAPALFFFVLKDINFSIAVAAALITLAPSGTAAPALTGLVEGNVAFSLFMTAATSLLFIPIAPTYLYALLGQHIPIDTVSLLKTLLYMIVTPLGVFSLIRWHKASAIFSIKTAASSVSVAPTFFIILIVIARLRNNFLDDPVFLVVGFFSISAIYAINYLVLGWAIGRREPRNVRCAMAISSGANNIALVLVLSVLYFPQKVQMLMVIGEVAWVLAIPAFRIFLARTTYPLP